MALTFTEKAKLKLIAIFLSLVVLACAVLVCFIYVEDFKETSIVQYQNDNGYTLEVVEVGRSNLDYGSINCKFKLMKNGTLVNTYKFAILNGKEYPDDENFDVEWGNENVRIIVSGQDQKDLAYFINYKD